MDQSVQVKVQYFHDALISRYEEIEMTALGNRLDEKEKQTYKDEMRILKEIIERHEDIFSTILFIE